MPEITLDNRSFSLLEYIYNNPYISYASLKTAFPSYNDIEDLVLSFDEQHLISLREASSLETDTDQYETYTFTIFLTSLPCYFTNHIDFLFLFGDYPNTMLITNDATLTTAAANEIIIDW